VIEAKRRVLHELLDAVPVDHLDTVRVALEQLADPVLLAFLAAPEDGEPLIAEDVAAIEEGKADVARGDVVSLDEVERRLSGRG
jgi:predicted transcriptional regulator